MARLQAVWEAVGEHQELCGKKTAARKGREDSEEARCRRKANARKDPEKAIDYRKANIRKSLRKTR